MDALIIGYYMVDILHILSHVECYYILDYDNYIDNTNIVL